MNTTLAVILLVGAINPARRAIESGRRPAAITAIASAAALAVYLGLAAVADGLLTELDVSSPNARIGAGAVVALRAGVELAAVARRDPTESTGRLAALVPVAFPILARPEVAALALAVGYEGGMGPVATGAMIGVGLAVAAIVTVAERPAMRWLAPAFSVIAVLAGLDMLVDAVLDV